MSDADQRCREALLLWMRWDLEHRAVTEALYRDRNDPAAAEQRLDDLESLHDQARAISREVLAV